MFPKNSLIPSHKKVSVEQDGETTSTSIINISKLLKKASLPKPFGFRAKLKNCLTEYKYSP